MLPQRCLLLLAAMTAAGASNAQAHFLWIAPDPSANERRIHVYFSETAEPDNPELLNRLKGLTIRQSSTNGKSHVLALTRGNDSLVAVPVAGESAQSYSLNYTYGVHSRDGQTYLLVYYARLYPAAPTSRSTGLPADQRLPLELIPAKAGGKLAIRVLWNGKPLSGAEVTADLAGNQRIEGVSDRAGDFSVSVGDSGICAFRAKYVEPVAGERGEKKYASIRHYSTLVVPFLSDRPGQVTARKVVVGPSGLRRPRVSLNPSRRPLPVKTASAHDSGRALPDLPFGVTSFGAAVADQCIYVCSGHLGPAHEYEITGQSDRFLRLDLRSPHRWEEIGTVPRRAGLAMVSYAGKVYRVGGFEARNKKGEPADLHSMPDLSRFDPSTRRWDDLPPMPRGRSSHDAIAVGSNLYVVGGWELRGSEPSIWHDSALRIDLAATRPTWEELPTPPFHRRASALGHYKGKLYVLGGMQEKGGPTTTTYVLDLASGKWSVGPKLPGDGLEGFGSAAAQCGGRLYATTYSGKICRLSEDEKEWQIAGQLERPRFFHRLVCSENASLIALGGANMEEGKNLAVDVIRFPSSR